MKVMKQALLTTALSMLAIAAYADTTSTNTAATMTTALTNTTTAVAAPASAAGPDVSGNYTCEGYDPFGKSNYANPVTVTKTGDTYGFQWLSSNGYPLILGTGVYNNNMLAVVFWDPKKQEYFGTEIYQVKGDVLQGNWTLQAQKQVGTETCTRKK